VVDLAGNVMSAPAVWSFTTDSSIRDSVTFSGLVSPTVVQFAPDGSVLVAEKINEIRIYNRALGRRAAGRHGEPDHPVGAGGHKTPRQTARAAERAARAV